MSRFKTLDENNKIVFKKYTSTAGRFLLANILPKNTNITFDLINRTLAKKQISEIIDIVFRFCGQKETVIFCDKLMDLGFKNAFKAYAQSPFLKTGVILPSLLIPSIFIASEPIIQST